MTDIIGAATAQADAAQVKSSQDWPIVAGPFKVGNIGSVRVVERTFGNGDTVFRYAEYRNATGTRPTRIPLAAAAVLVDRLRDDADATDATDESE